MATMHQNAFGGRAEDPLGRIYAPPELLATMVGLLLRGRERRKEERGRKGRINRKGEREGKVDLHLRLNKQHCIGGVPRPTLCVSYYVMCLSLPQLCLVNDCAFTALIEL